MKIIHIFGIPGVGKTSVINEAKKYIDFPAVNFGDYVLKICRKYGIEDRDEIRKKLSREEYIEVQKEAARLILEENKDKEILIIDNHLIIETAYGFYSGTPIWISDILKPYAIVLIVAPEDQILNRRIKDKTRKREISLKEIKIQQELTKMHAINLVFHYNCYLKIIENLDGKLEEAGKELAEYIKKLL